jgi:hypothetical protein
MVTALVNTLARRTVGCFIAIDVARHRDRRHFRRRRKNAQQEGLREKRA